MSLTPTQLSAIDQHLRKENWLLNEDLITELTDHYINGISDRLAQGMPFDVAVREIHAGFGGRKGLLKMEEDFHVSQTKNNGRIVRDLFKSYFRLPRMKFTLLLFITIYTFIRIKSTFNFVFLWHNWLIVGILSALVLSYILNFIQLTNPYRGHIKQSYNQTIIMSMQGFTAVLMVGFYINMVLPLDQLIPAYPLPTALLITAFLAFELATTELLFDQYNKKRNAKIA